VSLNKRPTPNKLVVNQMQQHLIAANKSRENDKNLHNRMNSDSGQKGIQARKFSMITTPRAAE